jgi:hypothetical protein
MTCGTLVGKYHVQEFCGPIMLHSDYEYHECDSLLCPLHARVVPKALRMEKGRIEALHAAVKQQHPVINDGVLTTISIGLEPSRDIWAREAQQQRELKSKADSPPKVGTPATSTVK